MSGAMAGEVWLVTIVFRFERGGWKPWNTHIERQSSHKRACMAVNPPVLKCCYQGCNKLY